MNVVDMKKLGSFDILETIGEGAFSVVKKAKCSTYPDKVFALKYIYPTTQRYRIGREIRILSSLKVFCRIDLLEFDWYRIIKWSHSNKRFYYFSFSFY